MVNLWLLVSRDELFSARLERFKARCWLSVLVYIVCACKTGARKHFSIRLQNIDKLLKSKELIHRWSTKERHKSRVSTWKDRWWGELKEWVRNTRGMDGGLTAGFSDIILMAQQCSHAWWSHYILCNRQSKPVDLTHCRHHLITILYQIFHDWYL